MAAARSIHYAPHRHELKIRAVLGNNLKSKIHEAIAWRAYQLYEQQGCVPGHDLENWARAEQEVVCPLDCGVLAQDHRVCVTADASQFDDGSIELYAEPRRITLAGFDRSRRPIPTPPGEPVPPRRDWIFRVHEFEVDLDPANVTARFNGPVLNIYLAKARALDAQPATAWVL
jgi:Protein of unknown function (DUF2934)